MCFIEINGNKFENHTRGQISTKFPNFSGFESSGFISQSVIILYRIQAVQCKRQNVFDTKLLRLATNPEPIALCTRGKMFGHKLSGLLDCMLPVQN